MPGPPHQAAVVVGGAPSCQGGSWFHTSRPRCGRRGWSSWSVCIGRDCPLISDDVTTSQGCDLLGGRRSTALIHRLTHGRKLATRDRAFSLEDCIIICWAASRPALTRTSSPPWPMPHANHGERCHEAGRNPSIRALIRSVYAPTPRGETMYNKTRAFVCQHDRCGHSPWLERDRRRPR
jgi:hypothetical protein